MLDALKTIVTFLEANNLGSSAKVLQDELSRLPKDRLTKTSSEAEKANLLKIINQAITNQGRSEAPRRQPPPKKPVKLLEETENIMEKFMNRLVGQPNLLEDERLNLKIERFFDNPTFQRMVEGTDVFNDLSNISFTNSILQKNNTKSQKKDPSWGGEGESLPHFGPQNESDVLFTDGDSMMKKKGGEHTPKSKNHHQREHKGGVPLKNSHHDLEPNRSPSMEDIFNPQGKQGKGKPQDEVLADAAKRGKGSEKKGEDGKTKSMDMPSIIQGGNQNDSSCFINEAGSLVLSGLEDVPDEYADDDDPGFDLYEVGEREFTKVAKQLADKYGFPLRAMNIDPNAQQTPSNVD